MLGASALIFISLDTRVLLFDEADSVHTLDLVTLTPHRLHASPRRTALS